MKKSIQNLRLRIMLISMFAVFSSIIWAQNYGLQINNVNVTDKNCNDLSVIEGVKGKVKYNPATKTLTLEDASITQSGSAYSYAGISNQNCPDLKIELKGSNKIEPSRHYAIDAQKSTTIYGEGKLTTNGGRGGLHLKDAPVIIENSRINIRGSLGIEGSGTNAKEILTIRNSSVEIYAYTYCIYNIGKLVLEESTISRPAGAAFDDEQHSVVWYGAILSGGMTISAPCYGVKLNGKEITKANCDNLNSIEGVSGNVKYDALQRILTLDNATISGQGIYNESCPDLRVELIGTNAVSSAGTCFNIEKPTAIFGEGVLTLTSSGEAGIKLNSASLAFEKGCTVSASGKYGIRGVNGNSSEAITVTSSNVEATGTEGAICSIGNLKLDDSFIRTPEGAAYDAGLKGVAVGGKVVTGKVAIAPLMKYGITVAGVEVTNLNCADLSMIDGVSGTISFDPATSTMTMQDVTLERTEKKDGVGISNRSCKDFKLNLIGQNIIRTYFSALSFSEPSIISGSGVVHASGSFGGGIYVDNTTLTIDDCEVYVNGAYGIAGAEERKDNKVVIRNAYVKLEGTEATMSWIDGFTLESCSIKEPEGVAYDATLRGLAAEGALVKSEVIIEPKTYGIVVAGTYVKGSNCADLSVIHGVEGNMAYDLATNTLTLENVTINTEDAAIYNESASDLKIILKGKNSIIAPDGVGVAMSVKTTIQGDGTLNIQGEGIITYDAPVIIDGCKIYIDGPKGIYGTKSLAGAADVGNEVLTVRNALVDIKSTTGAIPGIGGITLDDCYIAQPSGAVYSVVMRAVVYDGKLVTDHLIILPSSVGIEGVYTDTTVRRQGIYSMQGIRMDGRWETLPAGVYVVDGVKKVKE